MGKTTLAFALHDLLTDSTVVKLGEHPPKSKPATLMPLHTTYTDICAAVPESPFLILESGSILDDPDLKPDLVIFLPTGPDRTDKPGSERRRLKAHIVRDETEAKTALRLVATNLHIDAGLASRLWRAISKRPD